MRPFGASTLNLPPPDVIPTSVVRLRTRHSSQTTTSTTSTSIFLLLVRRVCIACISCVNSTSKGNTLRITMPPAVVQHAIQGIPPSMQWPVKTCIYTTATVYVLSVLTGNVSQVDRIWTFMPTIYTAYFALLPLWPRVSPLPLFPFTPQEVHPNIATQWNPRALLMFGLQASRFLCSE